MPVSLTISVAPVVLLIMMPPVGPGRSDTVIPFCNGVCNVIAGTAGGVARASAGTSAPLPQKQPTQIGYSGLPCSNSTHTPEPMIGKANMPFCNPAIGAHGIAQV